MKSNANRGKAFEQLLKSQAQRQHWEVIQIPTGAKWINRFKVIPVATPFDFVLINDFPNVIYCDAKQTENKTFPRTKIKPHQLECLYKLHSRKFSAGYIVNYVKLNRTVFFSANTLKDCHNGIFKNLKPEQGIEIGTNTEINLTMLRESALSV